MASHQIDTPYAVLATTIAISNQEFQLQTASTSTERNFALDRLLALQIHLDELSQQSGFRTELDEHIENLPPITTQREAVPHRSRAPQKKRKVKVVDDAVETPADRSLTSTESSARSQNNNNRACAECRQLRGKDDMCELKCGHLYCRECVPMFFDIPTMKPERCC